jgi:hypothetical protein
MPSILNAVIMRRMKLIELSLQSLNLIFQFVVITQQLRNSFDYP